MGFQDVNARTSGKARKASEMEIGDDGAITAYVVRIEESRLHEGTFNMVMQEQGSTDQFLFFTAGNLKWLLKDGKIKAGLLTKIVRLEDVKIKGKKATNFQVMQDAENTLEEASFNALGITPAAKTAERSKVSAQAAAIAAGMKRPAAN